MNKQELIKKIADEKGWSWIPLEDVLNAVDAEGWLRNPGDPIDPKDIKAGDRVRTEFENGTVFELTVPEGWVWTTAGYFLLDRPKPELQIPTCSGAGFIAYNPSQGDDPNDQEEFIVAGPSIVSTNTGRVWKRVKFEKEWIVTALVGWQGPEVVA